MRARTQRRVCVSLISCAALVVTSVLVGSVTATATEPKLQESASRATGALTRPGVLYTGSDIPLRASRNGATVSVTLPDNAGLRATTPEGHTSPDTMGSVARNWTALGMQRKGAAFWVRPVGARSVVRLGTPTIRDGLVTATTSADKWNAAVPPALRLSPAREGTRTRAAATTTGTSASIAAQSTTPVPVCPLSSYNWTGVCVLDGSSVSALLSFALTTGLSATATTCWEVSTPGSAPASFQAMSEELVMYGELQAQNSGQCLANEATWTPILMPTPTVDTSEFARSDPGVANSTYFDFSLKVQPPTTLPQEVQKLYLSIVTDPPNAGGAPVEILVWGS